MSRLTYRFLLRLLPAEFRTAHALEMENLFAEALQDGRGASQLSRLCGWFRGAFDVVALSVRLRWNRPNRNTPKKPKRNFMESIFQDIRFAFRSLRSRPLFTCVAVVTLGLGIGANTTVFSVVNAILLSGVPLRAPEELVEVYTSEEQDGYPYSVSSYPDYADLRERTDLFSGVGAFEAFFSRLETDDATEAVWGEVTSFNLFALLGLEPALGRYFVPEEGQTIGTHPVAVLGYNFWQQRYGSDSSVVGQTIRLGGLSYTVVGVASEKLQSFTAPGFSMDMWIPYMMLPSLPSSGNRELLTARNNRSIFIKARLRPDVDIDQARAALGTLSAQLQQAYPDEWDGREFNLLPTEDVAIHPLVDTVLYSVAGMLLTVVGLVLLIACTNLAGLLVARAADRKKEIAIRLALGARRSQLVRQFLTETVLLSLIGGCAGLLLAHWLLRLLVGFQPPIPIPINLDVGLDRTVLLFTLCVAMLAGLFFGLLPALQATKPDVAPTLKDDVGAGIGKQRRFNLKNGLIVTQVAISMILLLGAGLFIRSLQGAQDIDLGFTLREAGILWTMMDASGIGRDDWEGLASTLEEHAAAIPGVEQVATAEMLPLGVGFQTRNIDIPGVEPPPGDDHHEIAFNVVSPSYLDVMEIPVVAGRGISEEDQEGSAPVVAISETAARRYWPGENPIGREIVTPRNERSYRIVGVVKDAKAWTIGEEYRPYIYFARTQNPTSSMMIVARGGVPEAQIVGELRRVAREVDPRLVIMDSKTMTEHLSVMLFPPRMAALMLGVFGLIALVLASTGLYGVVAFTVSRRGREVGIRMSLGADAGSVIRMVLKGAMALVLIGGAIGLTLTVGLTRLISQFLYGVSGTDPITFLGVPLVLAAVALLAAFLPARKASKVDPVVALRSE
jgi:macrolide transport system ATP-binding/permease protein